MAQENNGLGERDAKGSMSGLDAGSDLSTESHLSTENHLGVGGNMDTTITRETQSGVGEGEWAIDAQGLAKSFGAKTPVNNITFRVARGTIHALLGPNGAGKSVSVGLLTTRLRPSDGQARVLGFDVLHEGDEIRRRIAVTGQNASLDEDLTGVENLRLMGRLFGLGTKAARERAQDLLRMFDLEDAAKRSVKTYSGGMRRRLDIGASLVVRPQLLFLDEPTTGLDPSSRMAVWDMVRALRDQGTTIVMTTQYLEEADQLADQISVIRAGEIIASGTPRELKKLAGAGALVLEFGDPFLRSAAEKLLRAGFGDRVRQTSPRGLKVMAETGDANGAPMVAFEVLKAAGMMPEEFAFARPSLDEVFFALTAKMGA